MSGGWWPTSRRFLVFPESALAEETDGGQPTPSFGGLLVIHTFI